MRLLLTAFFLETGVVLLLAPWSEFWDRNYFAQALPLIHALMINNFVRGAVSGLGIVNMSAAVAEMHAFFAERRIEHVISLNRSAAEE
jgi:polyferredoxin